jgi:uncharacterized protein (DUF486 family)
MLFTSVAERRCSGACRNAHCPSRPVPARTRLPLGNFSFRKGSRYTAGENSLYFTAEIIVRTIVLLTISNIFMTFAWYGHLKYRSEALWKVILASWGIAFFEYCFQVPANRIGSYEFTTAQLKTIQEVITLAVFSGFSILYLGEKLKWNYAAGFGCIALAVFFVFHKW